MKPYLLSSFATLTSRRISTSRPALAASVSICRASRRESTEWISTAFPRTWPTLLRCRWPIICQRISSGSSGFLAAISCTLFSPKSLAPAAYASSSMGTGLVLLTAISVTSPGFLPDRMQACSIRSFTSVKCSFIIILSLRIKSSIIIGITAVPLPPWKHPAQCGHKQKDRKLNYGVPYKTHCWNQVSQSV